MVARSVLMASWRWGSVSWASGDGGNQKCGGRRHCSSKHSQMPNSQNAAHKHSGPSPCLCVVGSQLLTVYDAPHGHVAPDAKEGRGSLDTFSQTPARLSSSPES